MFLTFDAHVCCTLSANSFRIFRCVLSTASPLLMTFVIHPCIVQPYNAWTKWFLGLEPLGYRQ